MDKWLLQLQLLKSDAINAQQRHVFQCQFQHLLGDSIPDLLDQYNRLLKINEIISFDSDFGFEPLSINDVQQFIQQPNQFCLSLNKQKGKQLLYGPLHTDLRRDLFNVIPQQDRINLFQQKCNAQQLMPYLEQFCSTYYQLDQSIQIYDVIDIGMARSVYRVELNDGINIVIKQDFSEHQTFYSQLLEVLSLPTFYTQHSINNGFQWEFTQYISNQTLEGYIQNTETVSEKIIQQLAIHSALGDIMGRGDRHQDNYLVDDEQLKPVDVSYLFWENNQDWVYKYVCGGMSEISVLDHDDDSVLRDQLELFFGYYLDACYEFKSKQDQLLETISWFYQNDTYLDVKQQFVTKKLNHIADHYQQHRQLYLDAFFEMKDKLVYKQLLAALVNICPEQVFKDQLLKMYFLADYQKSSVFFLYENHQVAIKQAITNLCQEFIPDQLNNIPENHQSNRLFKLSLIK